MKEDRTKTLRVEPGDDFVMTPFLAGICRRATACLETGYPVHLSGPAGTGKTTLALHLAGRLGRPVLLIYGDEDFGSSDLLGGNHGVLTTKLMDNFIHSVRRTEESSKQIWIDERLMIACREGYTLVYDEFSRSHAEANNVLLSILEEGVVSLPRNANDGNFMKVHPDFRVIFTSNPEEYAGVFSPQNALLDRMVTIRMGLFDRASEISITQSKTGLTAEEAEKLVDLVRVARNEREMLTVRACIMLGRIVKHRGGGFSSQDPILLETCMDVLGYSPGREDELLRLVHGAFHNENQSEVNL